MKKLFVCICMSFILLLLSSCSSIYSEPPTVEAMKVTFAEHETDFRTIADYLIKTCADLPDFKSATIKDNKLTMFRVDSDSTSLNRTDTLIADTPITDNCKKLKQAGCKDIGMCISGKETQNAVYFTMWSRNMKEADCGIAYAVNGTDPPVIQFQTELSPITNNGWYYFLADYEEWRNTKPTFNVK